MSTCTFCDIIAGVAAASIVSQDEQITAFMVLRPITPGHLVLVPNRHASQLAEMDESTGKHLFSVATRMAAALRDSGIRCEGVNLFLADGEAAGQTVFHVHLHVFPRYRDDPFRTTADASMPVAREELDQAAAQIRQSYELLQHR